jgi:trk system potassium uptake protein TrkH
MGDMNARNAIRVSALNLLLIAGAMLPVGLWSAFQGTRANWAAAEAMGTAIAIVLFAYLVVRLCVRSEGEQFGRREAFLMVGLTWLTAPVVAGLPFLLWAMLFHFAPFETHPFQSPINCYFEAVSGLTTTGASILSDIEATPRGLLLWRSTTHWLGGLGIVLLFVAILPIVGVAGKKLHSVESTGPSPQGVQPRIRDTARVLWITYAVLTLASIIALRLAGLPWFNAVCETFGSIATGGFSPKNTSIAAYDSGLVDAILIGVMLLGALNFSLYVQLARGRWRTVWRDPELRLFLGLIAMGSILVVSVIYGGSSTTIDGQQIQTGWLASLRYGVFNLVSMHTDTGFATAVFDHWPFLALAAIAFGTFIGGSAGSTTGGIKVIRVLVIGKVMIHELHRVINPRAVKTVRIGNRVLESGERIGIMVTALAFVLALLGGTIALMMIGSSEKEMELTTAFSASLANLCTAGPGFAGVGPDQNYLWLPDASKIVLCGLMLIGRLEIMPALAILTPRFWTSH